MNWTFIISFSTWSIYEIVICIRSYPSGFIVTESYFLLCVVADIIPITVVFYTHFRNTHQLNKIFLMSWNGFLTDTESAEQHQSNENENLMVTNEQLVVYLEGTDMITENSKEKQSSKGTPGLKESIANTNSLMN